MGGVHSPNHHTIRPTNTGTPSGYIDYPGVDGVLGAGSQVMGGIVTSLGTPGFTGTNWDGTTYSNGAATGAGSIGAVMTAAMALNW